MRVDEYVQARPSPGLRSYVALHRRRCGRHCGRPTPGAEIVRAPFDTDYGSRDCTARDPEGNPRQSGTDRGEPGPADG